MNKKTRKAYTDMKKRALTAGKLIEILRTMPEDAPIGKVGHFGEFNEMHPADIHVTDAYITPRGESWRSENRYELKVIDISVPDIGPDPD